MSAGTVPDDLHLDAARYQAQRVTEVARILKRGKSSGIGGAHDRGSGPERCSTDVATSMGLSRLWWSWPTADADIRRFWLAEAAHVMRVLWGLGRRARAPARQADHSPAWVEPPIGSFGGMGE